MKVQFTAGAVLVALGILTACTSTTTPHLVKTPTNASTRKSSPTTSRSSAPETTKPTAKPLTDEQKWVRAGRAAGMRGNDKQVIAAGQKICDMLRERRLPANRNPDQIALADQYLCPSVSIPTAEEAQEAEQEARYTGQGYRRLTTDGSVWGKWVDPADCDFGSCGQMRVIIPNGCSSLYVQVNLIDDSGTVIDYGNDLVSGLGPDGKALLTFHFSSDKRGQMNLAQVNCY